MGLTEHTDGLTKPYNTEVMRSEGHRTEGESRAGTASPTMRLECTGIHRAAMAWHDNRQRTGSCQLVINTVVFSPAEQHRLGAGTRL